MAFEAAIPIVAQLLTTGIEAGIGNKSIDIQKEIADQNLAFAKEAQQWQRETDQRNYDYMSATQQTEWERADTQMQRTVDDYIKAGLSPANIAGGNSGGSVVSMPGSPSPVVPQMDGSGIQNAMTSLMTAVSDGANLSNDLFKTVYSEKNENKRNELRTSVQIDIAEKQATNQINIVRAQLQSAENIASENRSSQERIANNQLVQANLQHLDNVNYNNRYLAELSRHNKASEIVQVQDSDSKLYQSITGFGGDFKKFYKGQEEEFKAYMEQLAIAYAEFLRDNAHLLGKVSVGKSSSHSDSTGVGSSLGANTLGMGGNFSMNISDGSSDSSSRSHSWDYSPEFYAKEKQFWLTHKMGRFYDYER